MRFLAIIALATACLAHAEIKTYEVKINDFAELTVVNNINVIYKSVPDSAGIAKFSCEADKADQISFTNDKGKLKIQSESELKDPGLPTVTIYSLALTKATNWGDSTITVATNSPGAVFKAKVIGNGNIHALGLWCTQVDAAVQAGNGHIYLSGKAQSAKYSIVSAGTIEAGALEAADVKCVMMGTGSVDCFATEKLRVIAAGSGKVCYRGNPAIKKSGFGVTLLHIDD